MINYCYDEDIPKSKPKKCFRKNIPEILGYICAMSIGNPTLFMVILGATPPGRTIEQHDVFFGINQEIKSLKPDMYDFWNDAGQLHIDSYRAVTRIDNFEIKIVEKSVLSDQKLKLFFINLGGYLPKYPEEHHFKILVVAETMAEAVKKAKQTAFYNQYGFKGAESHIDDKHALDVDDMHKVTDLLPKHITEQYGIQITPLALTTEDDEWQVGYLKLGLR